MDWDDDDEELAGPETASPFAADDEAEPTEATPTPEPTDAAGAGTPTVAPSDAEADNALLEQPTGGPDGDYGMLSAQPAPQTEDSETEEPEPAAMMAGPIQSTYKAPAPINLQKPSDAPVEAAQELAQAKADFDPSKYKPSGWRRAGAAVAGALTAFGSRDPEKGWKVGSEVLDAPLERAKAQEAQKEAGIQGKIDAGNAKNAQINSENSQEFQRYNADERNVRNQAYVEQVNAQAEQRRAQATAKLNTVDPKTLGPVDPKNPFGEWQGRTPGGQVVRGLEPPASVQKDPRYITQQRTQWLKDAEANGIKLTDDEKKYYYANGKLAEPTTSTHIDIHEKPDGSWAPPGNGGRPSGPHQQIISDTVAKATQDKQTWADGWHRITKEESNDAMPEGSYIKGNQVLTPKDFQDKLDKFRTDANVKLAKYKAHIDNQGNLVQEPDEPVLQPGKTQPQKQPQTQQTSGQAYKSRSGSMVKVGTPVNVAGRTGVVTGLDQQGKPIVKWDTQKGQ